MRAGLGVSVVGNDSSFVNSVLDKVRASVEDAVAGEAVIFDEKLEILHF